MSIARGKSTSDNILLMLLRAACCIFLMVPTLSLSGCADTVPADRPLKRFTDLVRGYDHTLTKTEKNAVIEELQNDQARQRQQAEEATATIPEDAEKQQ